MLPALLVLLNCLSEVPLFLDEQLKEQRLAETTLTLEQVPDAQSRNFPSFAVACNWGVGSSSVNADVNVFDRLEMVRGGTYQESGV